MEQNTCAKVCVDYMKCTKKASWQECEKNYIKEFIRKCPIKKKNTCTSTPFKNSD